MERRNTCIRLSFYIIGLLLFSSGISLTIQADIGVSSWDAVSVGLYRRCGFSIGVWMSLISFTQIVIGSVLNKERVRAEALLISICMGALVDGSAYVLHDIPSSIWCCPAITYACGVLLISIGCGTYLASNYLPAAIDYFMLSIKRRCSFSIAGAMLVCEFIGLLFALICRGPVGYGTLIATFLYGPMIDLAHAKAEKLYKRITIRRRIKRMNILLVCGMGASTSIVVNAMKEHLADDEKNWIIEARSSQDVKEIAGKYDLVLLAPQVRYQKEMIEEYCTPLGVSVMILDSFAYGTCNGESIMHMVRGGMKNV